MECSLEDIWNANANSVRRLLLALARDIDLAEDCLQETYVRACSGISSYRGGNPQAWLMVIAKNVFYGYARRKSFHPENSLETASEIVDNSATVGSDNHLDILVIRDKISALDPDLRTALIMKHYGDYDYEDIAKHLSCTPTAAKQRVWRAMQELRTAVCGGKEDDVLDCSELRGARILDWLYGVLSPLELKEIESHMTLCSVCRRNLTEMQKLAVVLNKAEGDHRILTLIELDQSGSTTRYAWVKQLNDGNDILHTWHWNAREDWTIDYLALQGRPVEFRWPDVPQIVGFKKFEADLPSPVSPGQTVDAMFVAKPPAQSHWEAESLGNGVWHYHHKHTPFPSQQAVFIVTIRLPQKARILKAEPPPVKISTRAGLTSLTWQVITEIVNSLTTCPRWQFEADLEYVVTTL